MTPREVGRVADIDGDEIAVSVDDYGSVRLNASIGLVILDRAQQEQFAQLYTRACWLAGHPEAGDG